MAPQQTEPSTSDVVDVLVLGGGAAGLSGALTLARGGRQVLVVDAGEPRRPPRRAARRPHRRLRGRARGRHHRARPPSAGGHRGARRAAGRPRARRTVGARRVALPLLPRLRGPRSSDRHPRDEHVRRIHQALLWRQWSPKITLFTAVAGTTVTVEPEQREQLDARGILVLDVAVAGVVVTDDPLNGDRLSGDRLSGVRLADGTTRELAALVAAGRVTPNDGALAGLHLARTEVRMGEVMFGSVLEADANGATPIPGVWVAGNVADLRAQVIGSAAAGVNAAGMINSDLVQEDVQRAVAARRDATGEQADPHHVWDELYRTREQFWSGRPNAVLEDRRPVAAGQGTRPGLR